MILKFLLKVKPEVSLIKAYFECDTIRFKITEITTVEGVINRAVTGLEQDQDKRRNEHPEVAAQIDSFIEKLNGLKELSQPFTLVY